MTTSIRRQQIERLLAVACVLLTACGKSGGGAGTGALSNSLFAVVATRGDTACIQVPKSAGELPENVLVVIPGQERSTQARVAEAMQMCADETASAEHAYYRLESNDLALGDLGIAVLTPTPPTVNALRTDIDQDGTSESYRACPSREGVHLTVWQGEPLTSKRVWHHYYYLGYDTEPTCVEADYAEADTTR